VLGKCGGYDSDIQDAMLWAGGFHIGGIPDNPNPARVINLSLGSAGACNARYQQVVNQLTAAGVVVVAAAGNDGLAVGTPANCAGVIAVAGVRHAGTKVGFSDLGTAVALSAPAGNCVNLTGDCLYPLITTTNAGTTAPLAYGGVGVYSSGGANASLGTSFSAPLVAGAAALMFSANAALTPAQVLAALRATARPFPTTSSDPTVPVCSAPSNVAQTTECICTTSTCGAGMLDAGQAVLAVASVVANIGVASTAVPVGSPISLDGSGSRVYGSGQTIQTYQWAITRGANIASFTSATNASTAMLVISASGIVEVGLTVTDSAARQDTTSVALSAGSATPSNPTPLPAPLLPGDGGGGAIGWGGLLAGLAALIAVGAVTPRRAQR
ncbi:MAG: S8 family serine peptidase, partial [Burkholderiaceae bacterium]